MHRFLNKSVVLLSSLLQLLLFAQNSLADDKSGTLDLYFIDVEGGAANLIVTPEGESLLIDSGYPDNQGRDLNRILKVARETAGLSRIDHAIVSHWHLDHYGNHAALAAEIGIGTFWDRGIPDDLPEDAKFHERIAAYRGATQNKSKQLRAGDHLPLRSGNIPLRCRVLAASRETVSGEGARNPFADEHQPQAEDKSDNAASLVLLFSLGEFRYLTCGDLTWNTEAKLVTPRNPAGRVDLFMVTHHGLPVSNNPALVLAIDPVTAIMCNGPKKGGAPATLETLRRVTSLQHWYQLHRNVDVDPAQQAPADQIANQGTTAECNGNWILARVAADGKSYTIQVGPDGLPARYSTRDEH